MSEHTQRPSKQGTKDDYARVQFLGAIVSFALGVLTFAYVALHGYGDDPFYMDKVGIFVLCVVPAVNYGTKFVTAASFGDNLSRIVTGSLGGVSLAAVMFLVPLNGMPPLSHPVAEVTSFQQDMLSTPVIYAVSWTLMFSWVFVLSIVALVVGPVLGVMTVAGLARWGEARWACLAKGASQQVHFGPALANASLTGIAFLCAWVENPTSATLAPLVAGLGGVAEWLTSGGARKPKAPPPIAWALVTLYTFGTWAILTTLSPAWDTVLRPYRSVNLGLASIGGIQVHVPADRSRLNLDRPQGAGRLHGTLSAKEITLEAPEIRSWPGFLPDSPPFLARYEDMKATEIAVAGPGGRPVKRDAWLGPLHCELTGPTDLNLMPLTQHAFNIVRSEIRRGGGNNLLGRGCVPADIRSAADWNAYFLDFTGGPPGKGKDTDEAWLARKDRRVARCLIVDNNLREKGEVVAYWLLDGTCRDIDARMGLRALRRAVGAIGVPASNERIGSP